MFHHINDESEDTVPYSPYITVDFKHGLGKHQYKVYYYYGQSQDQ